MALRIVHGTMLDMSGAPVVGQPVICTLSSPVATTSLDVVVPLQQEQLTDVNGLFVFSLFAQADLTLAGVTVSTTYSISLSHSGVAFAIVVPSGAYPAGHPTYFDIVADNLIVAMPAPYPVQVVTGPQGPAGGGASLTVANTWTQPQSMAVLDDGGAVFNVKHPTFGAKGDGVTNDSAAIHAAVNAAAATISGTSTGSRGTVYFPAGVYIITTTACLTPTNTTSMPGVHFQGSGQYASILRYGSLSGSTWFYDNGATARTNFNTFQNLGFEGMDPANFSVYTDIPTNANGFKVTSAGNEQGFRFFGCRFSLLNVMFDMEGTNTASEMFYFGCTFLNCRSTFYLINNPQSYNHEFHGCEGQIFYGDVFKLGTAGNSGGAIKVFGGSWIMGSDSGANTYFVNAVGTTVWELTLQIYLELHGNFANLVNSTAQQSCRVHFKDSSFLTSATSNLTSFCTALSFSTVDFTDCTFLEQSTGLFQFAAGAWQYGESGTITFTRCTLPVDWSDRCSITNFGAIRAIDCRGANVGTITVSHWAHDFDLSWDETTPGLYTGWKNTGVGGQGSPTNASYRLKSCLLKLVNDYWPTNQEQTLKLPKDAIIKNIHLRKPAGSADATVTTMIVGRSDKSGTPHATSNSAAMNVPHAVDVSNYFYHVGTTTNERTLRLYSSAATSGTLQGGFVLVEYY